jgi:hypothetical protein
MRVNKFGPDSFYFPFWWIYWEASPNAQKYHLVCRHYGMGGVFQFYDVAQVATIDENI